MALRFAWAFLWVSSFPSARAEVRSFALPDFPIVYVIYTPGGVPQARAVVAPSEPCPKLKALAGAQGLLKESGNVSLRAVGSQHMPHRFPVKVCQVQLPTNVPAGTLVFGRPLPRISAQPIKTLLLGDTGLRVKAKNDGTCLHPGPKKLYGIKQCQASAIIPFNASLVSGSFQNLSEWHLKAQMDAAASDKPDLVVHVGDYFYRQGPCPQNKPCTAINNASFPHLPGAWGDNWNGWYADFFAPSLSLLSKAPWIVLRGNHERCDRGGGGYFLFLDPRNYPNTVAGGEFCVDYTDPYTVPFAKEQFLVMDTAMVDDVDVDDVCPTGALEQFQIFPSNRLEDPDQDMTREEILEQVERYRQQFKEMAEMKQLGLSNFLLSHHPMFGFKCNQGAYESAEWTLQQALGRNTLEGISATIHGHFHFFQLTQLAGLPPHFIVGNGGTMLRRYDSLAQGATGMDMVLPWTTVKVRDAFTKSVFGYSSLLGRDNYIFTAFQRNQKGQEQSMWNTSFTRAQMAAA